MVTLGPLFATIPFLYLSGRTPETLPLPLASYVAFGLFLQSLLLTFGTRFVERNRKYARRVAHASKVVHWQRAYGTYGAYFLCYATPWLIGTTLASLCTVTELLPFTPILFLSLAIGASMLISPLSILIFEEKYTLFFTRGAFLILLPLSALITVESVISMLEGSQSNYLMTPVLMLLFLNSKIFGSYSICYEDENKAWDLVLSLAVALLFAAVEAIPAALSIIGGVA